MDRFWANVLFISLVAMLSWGLFLVFHSEALASEDCEVSFEDNHIITVCDSMIKIEGSIPESEREDQYDYYMYRLDKTKQDVQEEIKRRHELELELKKFEILTSLQLMEQQVVNVQANAVSRGADVNQRTNNSFSNTSSLTSSQDNNNR